MCTPQTSRWILPGVIAAAVLAAGLAHAVDTAVVLEPEPEVIPEAAPVPVAAANPLQTGLAETLELLQKNGLMFDEAAAQRSMIEAVATTADPFARLLSSEEHRRLAESADGVAYDTGIRFVQSNRLAVVTGVAEGSAAAAAGLQAGDNLLSIGNTLVSELDVARIQEGLRGMEPAEVAITVQRGEEDPEEHSLEQLRVQLDSIEESVRLPAGLGYVRINGLFPGAGVQVADVLTEWSVAGIDGVALDLRGANGGDLESVITVASLMSKPDTVLFTYRDAAGQDLEVHKARTGPSLGVPLMLLVDDRTSGAAELLAAVLSGAGHGAMLIGFPTAGDPMIREAVPLADGYVLYIASRRLVVPEGKTYAGKERVRPDIVVSPHAVYPDFDPAAPLLTDPRGVTDAELETQELRIYINGDIPLTRAVDVLLGLKALNLHSFDYEGTARP